MTEISITIPELLFPGNALNIPAYVNLDLTDYKITVNIFDQFRNTDILATANVVDGSDDQVEVTDVPNGEFVIKIPTGMTDNYHVHSFIEIDFEDPDGNLTTVYYAALNFTIISHLGNGNCGC